MKNVIRKTIEGTDIQEIFNYVLRNIYQKGPVSTTDMEILSYLAIYQPIKFDEYRMSILNYMGIFFKETERETLRDAVFGQYKRYILDTYNKSYTPVQASIVKGIENNKCFSFSAPTSTGKSFVIMDKIKNCINDVVVVVPSRALINEYYSKLSEQIKDKSINLLTFIDKINTQFANKNIFIVTPERCRELFRQKDNFNIELFLFDEAQLSNEDSKRGLYFDSIVRRSQKAFPNASFVFAHPFVKNPDSQIKKNHFDNNQAYSVQYVQKNVGQLFLCTDEKWNFFHFGIEKDIMGATKQPCNFDPIEKTIVGGGSVLFYISKAKIYNKGFLNQFSKYIDLCNEIDPAKIGSYIEKLKSYTGGDTIANKNHYSQMIALLKRGIVIHHGSLPLQTRLIIEQFTKDGHCKLCFATSTLEQGVNMPFDVVFLDRLETSKSLSVKNLIGRAGRSTLELKFDYGYVILSSASKISSFRTIINQDEELDTVSGLEKNEPHDEDYNDFKEAILNNTLSDEFNLAEKDIEKITTDVTDTLINNILNSVFKNDNTLLTLPEINNDEWFRLALYENFKVLYSEYLGRDLGNGEANVLNTAIKIILWRIHGKTFKNICWYRYSYVTKSHERETLERLGRRTDQLMASFFTGYHDIPDKTLNVFSLFPIETKAIDVDYDLIMYDTYDYIDKLIGFKLSDIFYAAFIKYYEKTFDERANRMAKFIKFGTDNERHIWMLRYGLSFEDIEVLDKHIEDIDEKAIVFRQSIDKVSEEDKFPILRFIN